VSAGLIFAALATADSSLILWAIVRRPFVNLANHRDTASRNAVVGDRRDGIFPPAHGSFRLHDVRRPIAENVPCIPKGADAHPDARPFGATLYFRLTRRLTDHRSLTDWRWTTGAATPWYFKVRDPSISRLVQSCLFN
jgi:hypothetical protein